MVHHYQKRWVFTWKASTEDQIVDPQKLISFLNETVESGVFQKEQGLETNRLHYQGRFEKNNRSNLLTIYYNKNRIMAVWPSGKAVDCKSSIPSSNLGAT